MKPIRHLCLGLPAFAMLLGTSCGRAPEATVAGVTVVTTIHALSTIVAPVVGPDGSVIVLLPSGANPHAYEPRPSDLRKLTAAHLVFHAGRDVDGWVANLVPVSSVALMDLVHAPARGRTGIDGDSHVWLDPEAVASALPGLASALCQLDPPGCSGYRDRARTFASSMPILVERIQALTGHIRDGLVVTSGPFLGHWSVRFGPRIAGSIEESEGVEPSASRMGGMISAARGAIAVVGQASLPSATARAVAEAAAVPYVEVDIVGTPANAPDYARLLLSIAEALPEP